MLPVQNLKVDIIRCLILRLKSYRSRLKRFQFSRAFFRSLRWQRVLCYIQLGILPISAAILHWASFSMTFLTLHPIIRWLGKMPGNFRDQGSTPTKLGMFKTNAFPLSTSVLCRRLQRAKIPDSVRIQFFLLKMGTLMLETCRG